MLSRAEMNKTKMRGAVLLWGTMAGVLWIGRSLSPYAAEGQAVRAQSPEMNAHIEAGNTQFQQKCAFCHGRDAGGGESGPDLTRSKLVQDDVNGNKIAELVRTGRPGKMPPFDLADPDMKDLVAFIHAQQQKAVSAGQRKGVDVSDLQTGNVTAGKQYFEGAGTCSKCHSATGDLAHIATKYQGLKLEQHMLYPHEAKSTATVTLPSGESLRGQVEYHDEFTLGIFLADGTYRSWPVNRIKYKIDAPHEAHAELLSKYTDDDIHNLMAYLQTLR
ncbi:cytochrome c oxidase cbb3-type subunit 3 [Edaphobacter modestus]|uniref:Cytochrome c oxidase cbb3-type subunit 3 n=2 Tax=Edaphobacter modestus TaxID=388466 RepID=A0A4Q7YSQ5_9BACT|nr:cytochrome c oxidase cbb3-type subunit 3 [Edaphobacter modestus]